MFLRHSMLDRYIKGQAASGEGQCGKKALFTPLQVRNGSRDSECMARKATPPGSPTGADKFVCKVDMMFCTAYVRF
jgi:hypothetical protein